MEIDGDVHELSEQKEHDIERQKHLEMYGIMFLRIKNEEIFGNPNEAFKKIEKEIHYLTSQSLSLIRRGGNKRD